MPQAKAYVNQVSDSDVFFHQTDSTGYTPFGIGDTLTDEQGNTGTINVAPAIEDLLNLSGDVLYIENRAPVIRDASQTEDIKVVVTL